VNRLISFLIIVLGTGVVSKLGMKIGLNGYFEVGTVVVATAQLVFDFGTKARQHDFLQRRYYELLSEIESKTEENEHQTRQYSAKLLILCAEEPMTMRALDAIAYNKAVDATIFDTEDQGRYRLKVTKWQRFMRQILAFQNVNFVPEIDAVEG
jgi:hypothetical protein